MKVPPSCETQARRDVDPEEADYRSLRRVYCPGYMTHGQNGGATTWIKALAAPLLSAIITGGIMYVTVRVELAAVAARQDLVLRELASIRGDLGSIRNEVGTLRERVAAVETQMKHP